MIIYVIYQQFYADFENGENDAVYMCGAYRNKRKAVKKANRLVNKTKSNYLYIDDDIRNKRNPFKNNNCVDFYKNEEEQTDKVSSIVIEEIKLAA